MLRSTHNYLLVALICGIVCLMYSVIALGASAATSLTREDGVVETLGAVFFLGCAVVLAIVYLRSARPADTAAPVARHGRRNVFYLLLALLFLLGFLEEISWGQRFLGVRTPEVLLRNNRQNELNVHNLRWFHGLDERGERKSFWQLLTNMDRLFSMFQLAFCGAIPILYRYSRPARRALARIRMPIVPLVFAFLFGGNYALSKVLEQQFPSLQHPIIETKETACAFLFLCVAIAQRHGQARPAASVGAAGAAAAVCRIDVGGSAGG